jgi:hypothetical protein
MTKSLGHDAEAQIRPVELLENSAECRYRLELKVRRKFFFSIVLF